MSSVRHHCRVLCCCSGLDLYILLLLVLASDSGACGTGTFILVYDVQMFVVEISFGPPRDMCTRGFPRGPRGSFRVVNMGASHVS